jgi:hypothetical protein
VTGCVTNLLGIGAAEWERPGGEQVLASAVDSTRRKDDRVDLRLQPGDQLHVQSEREDSVDRQDTYRMPRVSSTKVAKQRGRYIPTAKKKGNRA